MNQNVITKVYQQDAGDSKLLFKEENLLIEIPGILYEPQAAVGITVEIADQQGFYKNQTVVYAKDYFVMQQPRLLVRKILLSNRS